MKAVQGDMKEEFDSAILPKFTNCISYVIIGEKWAKGIFEKILPLAM